MRVDEERAHSVRRFSIAAIVGLVLCSLAFAQPDPEGRKPPDGVEKPSRDYTIGIEDVLGIRVWQEPDLTVSVSVRPDGKITVPLANDVYVEGLSPEEAGRVITEQLVRFVRDVHVTVIVEQINSFRVFVLGEVNTQSVLTFQQPTRLLQAIAHAGGVTQFSKKITIIRQSSGTEKRIQVDYKKLLDGDPSQENIWLKPGDTILVE